MLLIQKQRGCLQLSPIKIDLLLNLSTRLLCLLNFFSTVYSSDNVNYEDLQVDVLYPDLLCKISTTQSEVENILVNLDAKKATGVDDIPARI